MFKIRVILDTEEDVIRTLRVRDSLNLEEFHQLITKSFGFSGEEMASFFRTDDTWNQGEEIPLFDMSDSNTGITMKKVNLSSMLSTVGDKLIYIYDFMNMWAFFVELIEIDEAVKDEDSKVILSVGEVPKKAPDKMFISDSEDDFLDEEIDDELDDYDDFYADNY